jgi:hypothetical protein
MQAVLCLSQAIGEEFVIPTAEIEFASARRLWIHPLGGDLVSDLDDSEKSI